MNIKPGQEIGVETHDDNDQFFRVEHGQGKCIIDNHETEIKDGFAIIIPAWVQHNIINTSLVQDLKVYTLYSPPHHKDKTIHPTKHDAELSDEEFDGKTTE
jgi:mannose-6-phosphate isomerase-like protein (cupin superfamily)